MTKFTTPVNNNVTVIQTDENNENSLKNPLSVNNHPDGTFPAKSTGSKRSAGKDRKQISTSKNGYMELNNPNNPNYSPSKELRTPLNNPYPYHANHSSENTAHGLKNPSNPNHPNSEKELNNAINPNYSNHPKKQEVFVSLEQLKILPR